MRVSRMVIPKSPSTVTCPQGGCQQFPGQKFLFFQECQSWPLTTGCSPNDHPRLALRPRLGLADQLADHPGNVPLAEEHEIQVGHERAFVGPAEMDLRRHADA